MKKSKMLLALIALPAFLFSQNIAETIYKIEKSYKPLFSKDEGSIEMRLLKIYVKEQTDTAYSFTIRVVTKNAEAVGGTASFALSRRSWAAGASEAYIYNKEDKFIALTLEQLGELKDGINKVYLHANQSKVENVCTVTIDRITVGAEFIPGGKLYYFIAIEDAIFEMDKYKFLDLVETVKKANSYAE